MKNDNIDQGKTKARLEALSDGIFAITMTMMIIDLKIPENSFHNLSPSELNTSLLTLLPSIKSYILSFFILAIFWMRQQLQLNRLINVTINAVLIYIIFLLLIGFVPFTVNLIKRYPDYHTPFIIYTLNLLLISIILFVSTLIASNENQENNEETGKGKRFLSLAGVTILIFLAGFIISFYDMEIAFYVIILDPVYFFLYRRFTKNKI